MSLSKWAGLLSQAVFVSFPSAATLDITKTVDSHSGPWTFVNGGLNTSFQYGVGDETGPTIFSAADGFDFTAGNTFTIAYLSGLVSAGGGFPATDANGDTALAFNNLGGSSGKGAPSKYMNTASYPINLTELVGTFANSAGALVGTPFKIGDLGSAVVPVGATRLQLGVNDDIFGDNSGSFSVKVSGPMAAASVPEPSTFGLLALGIAAAIGLRRK